MLMTVGQFAQLTGLTVTALRFYDEKGLLTPRDIDPHNGYRRYGSGQVRRAAMIKVLRDMGLSLPQVRAAVDEPHHAVEIVEQFVDELAGARARQDEALERGLRILTSYEAPTAVQERCSSAQPWIGAVVSIALDGADTGADAHTEARAEQLNTAFADLGLRLQSAGTPPTGPFWTTIRPSRSPTEGELVLCWPVTAPVPSTFEVGGLRLEQGTLPRRSEAYVELRFEDVDYPQGPPGTSAPHPAMVRLLEYLEIHGVQDGDFRHIGVIDEGGAAVGIEIAVTIDVLDE